MEAQMEAEARNCTNEAEDAVHNKFQKDILKNLNRLLADRKIKSASSEMTPKNKTKKGQAKTEAEGA